MLQHLALGEENGARPLTWRERHSAVDEPGFDRLTRILTLGGSRRTAFVALLGAAGLAVRGWRGSDEALADSGRCRPACGPCARCQLGKCHKTKHGTRVCTKGKCRRRPDDAPCNGTGRCLQGTCNPQPTCMSGSGASPCAGGGECCSGRCLAKGFTNNPTYYCDPSLDGEPCLSDDGCWTGRTGNRRCIGFRCQSGDPILPFPGTCPTGTKYCLNLGCLRPDQCCAENECPSRTTCGPDNTCVPSPSE
jgi:hypothetical protein